MDDGIALEELEVAHTPPPEEDQDEQDPDHGDHTEIGDQSGATQVATEPPIEIDALKIAGEELETGEGGQTFGGEFESERTIDTEGQIGFSSSQ